MINVAIYARKSKATETGDSIDTQIQKCKNYIESTLETDDAIQYHYYSDEGFSGASTDRPEFQRLLSDVKEGRLNYLVCYKLDRIARCLLDFESIHRLLEAHNVFLLSCIDRFDTSTENGKAFMRILLVFAELERGNIALRIKDAMLNLAESGLWSGGTAPIGYKATKSVTTKSHSNKVRKLTTLTIDEEYAPTVRLIFDKYLELGSISAVDTYLLQHNVKTRSGANFRTNTIREILRNPTYCCASPDVYRYFSSLGCSLSFSEDECIDTLSFIQYNRTKKKVEKKGQVDELGSTKKTTLKNDPSEWIIALGVHQSIIPSIQWLKVQQQLAQNADKKFGSSSGSTSKIGLLSGLLFCAKCGAPMRIMGHSILADGTISYSYRCNTKVRSEGTLCNADNALGHYLDPYIIEQVKHLLSNQETFIEQLKEHHTTSIKYHTDTLNTEPLLHKKLAEIEKDISNLMSRLMKCTNDTVAEEIEKGIETLKTTQKSTLIELEKIRNLKQGINTSKDNIQALIDFLQEFTHSIDDASLNEKRMLLRNIISRIEWNGDTKEVNIFFITDSHNINSSSVSSSSNNSSYSSNPSEYHEFRRDFLRESNRNLYTGSKISYA